MKITLPENISEITLEKYVEYMKLLELELDELTFKRRLISLFTSITFKETRNADARDLTRCSDLILKAINTEVEPTYTFFLDGIEYGLIPNMDKIKTGEHADLVGFDHKTELHKLMALLFRPVIKKQGERYLIEDYNYCEERAEKMKQMPLHVVNGAMVFFYRILSNLEALTQTYLDEQLQKVKKPKTTLKISDFIRRLRS